MKKVFIIDYDGFNPEIPKHIIYSNYESAKNFILNEYRKEWSYLQYIEGFPSPEEAREKFEENNSGVPYFAHIITPELRD